MLLQNVVLDDSTLQVLDDCVRVLDDSLPVLYDNFRVFDESRKR